jgi:putative heme-binding domain-containing protein
MQAPLSTHLNLPAAALLALIATALPCRAQRDLQQLPEPNPAAELAAMQLDPAIEVNLFAADPAMAKPIHMNVDAQGRVWLATSRVYPQLEPGEVADDQIIVLEDTNGDGQADRQTVFAEGLLIPTGILPGDGGVYVAASTQLLHLMDTTGDGRADARRVVLSGFGTEDTHHLLHTLRWGPDGWIYMNQSIYIHSHVDTPFGTERLDGGGIWRFHPRSGRLEVFCRGFVNPWGHIFDATGQSFATDGAYFDGINHVFPGSVFATAPGAERWLRGLNPGSPKHCGLEILTGEHVPPSWRGSLVTSDFRSHRVNRFQIETVGDGFRSIPQPDLIRSQHTAFRPIDAKMAADGTLLVADWYNPIIQHGEVDFRDPRRDRERGRIWRLRWPDRPTLHVQFDPSATTTQLIANLDASEEWTRQWSRLELRDRPWPEVKTALEQWVAAAHSAGDEPLLINRLREQAWVHECCQQLDPQLLQKLLDSQSPSLRALGCRLVSQNAARLGWATERLSQAASDPDWLVRLEAISGLRRTGDLNTLPAALAALQHPVNDSLDFALWSFVREAEQGPAGPELWQQLGSQLSDNQLVFVARSGRSPVAARLLLQRLADNQIPPDAYESVSQAIASRADAKLGAALLQWLETTAAQGQLSAGQAAGILQRLVDANPPGQGVPEGAQARLASWAQLAGVITPAQATARGAAAPNPDFAAWASQSRQTIAWQQQIVRAVNRWQLADLATDVADRLDQLLPESPPGWISQGLELLGSIDRPSLRAQLVQLASSDDLSAELRRQAIISLAGRDLPQAIGIWRQALSQDPGAGANLLGLADLARRQGGTDGLRQAVEQLGEVPPEVARQALSLLRDASISDAGLLDAWRSAGRLQDSGWKLTPQLVDQLATKIRTDADPARGEQIYRRQEMQCQRCHRIGPSGGQIGPNLVSLGGASDLDYIVESLIEPDAKLKEGFQTLVVLTEDGQIYTGLQLAQTEQTTQLVTAEGEQVTIDNEEILETRTGKSLMPAGLVDELSLAELADLTAFLAALGKLDDFSVTPRPWIRHWEQLKWTPTMHQLIARTSVDAISHSGEGIEWNGVESLVSGKLPLTELERYQPHREVPARSFVRCHLRVQDAPATVRVAISHADQVLFWLNGQPQGVDQLDALQLEPGEHTLIFGLPIDRISRFDAELASSQGGAVEVIRTDMQRAPGDR